MNKLLLAMLFLILSIIASDYSFLLQVSLFIMGFGLCILGILGIDFDKQ